MKANEIMTGDYFRIAQTGKIIKIVAVDECSGSVDYFDGDAGGVLTIGVEKIEPIPLTAEILEKNGLKWLYSEPSGNFAYCSNEPPIHCTFIPNSGWFISIGASGSTKVPLVEASMIQHVHQLQHALKPCGIKKEIVL